MKRLINTSSKLASNSFKMSWIKTFKRPSKPVMFFSSAFFLFSGLVIYDKKEKKRILEKYCDKVRFLAKEPMGPLDLPRKVKIYMSSFPGSDLWVSRMHFQEYIRPILQASAVDYEIIEGSKEGDLQRHISEEIRRLRRGESSMSPEMLKIMKNVRSSTEEDCAIIIGRQTLKEYLTGIHDGWLGLLEFQSTSCDSSEMPANELKGNSAVSFERSLQSSLPSNFSVPVLQYVPLSHVLGFFNIPIRIYQFLNRRSLAQSIASKIVDVVLTKQTRPWKDHDQFLGEEECHNWSKQYRIRTTAGVWTDELTLNKDIMNHVRVYCSFQR